MCNYTWSLITDHWLVESNAECVCVYGACHFLLRFILNAEIFSRVIHLQCTGSLWSFNKFFNEKLCATRITPIAIDWNRVPMKSVNTFFYTRFPLVCYVLFRFIFDALIYRLLFKHRAWFPFSENSFSASRVWEVHPIYANSTHNANRERWILNIFPWCQLSVRRRLFGVCTKFVVNPMNRQQFDLLKHSVFIKQFKRMRKVKMQWNLFPQICECLWVKYGVKDFYGKRETSRWI